MSSKKEKDKDKRPEWMDNLEKRLMAALENQSEIVLKRLEDMEGKMDAKIEGIRFEVQNSVARIKVVEQKTMTMECDLMEKK